MIDAIVAMKADLEMLKTAFGSALKVGPVEEVDAGKGYRLKLGDGPDGPYLSPWYPHPESGGQTSSWMPLSKGQIVGVINPNGDPRQGIILRAGFGGDNKPPSEDLAANVLEGLGITVTVKDGKVTLEGDFEVSGNVDFRDGYVHHNDTPIDDTHRHEEVMKGGDVTGEPID